MIYGLPPCPVCGGAEATEVATRAELLAEMELLWAFQGRRLRPDVPTRELADRVVFSRPPALRLACCPGCGTVRRSPGERPDALVEAYAGECADAGVLAELCEAQRAGCRAQARRLARILGRAGSGLEVGSYTGAFLAAACDVGWRFEGVDPNPVTAAFARARGLAVTEGTIETVLADAGGRGRPARRFDAIAFWNCFDQLPDPRAAALAARDLLAPGGVLALRVPNGACYMRLRRLRGPLAPAARAVQAFNNLLTFPYGYGFTPDSLGRLLRDLGFTLVHIRGDVLVRTARRWLRPWAALEERAARALLLPLARARPATAPWFEIYARK